MKSTGARSPRTVNGRGPRHCERAVPPGSNSGQGTALQPMSLGGFLKLPGKTLECRRIDSRFRQRVSQETGPALCSYYFGGKYVHKRPRGDSWFRQRYVHRTCERGTVPGGSAPFAAPNSTPVRPLP